MAGYTLDFPTQMQGSQFPDWMPRNAPTKQLKGARRKLGEAFDFDPIAQTGNQFINSQFANQSATASAASRAAENRAMLSGGRFGGSFARASAMLPLYAQQNEQAFRMAGLQGQMNAQRAGLDAQLAQSIAASRGQHTGLMANYAMGQQRMAQDESQFGRDFGLRERATDAELEMSAERLRMLRAQNNRQQAMDSFGQPMRIFGDGIGLPSTRPGDYPTRNPSSLWLA